MRFRVSALLVGLWACSVASIARADRPPPDAREEKEGAQQTFEAGSKLYDGKHFEEALVAFRASYQIVESPNSHLMIARCLRELGRTVEAYREFEAVIQEASAKGEHYESAEHAATEELADLKTKVGLLTIHLSAPPEGIVVKIDGKAVDAVALAAPIPLDPATVVVTGEAPGGEAGRVEVKVVANESPEVTLVLTKPEVAKPAAPPPVKVAVVAPPSHIPLRTWAYVAGGVGVAGLATFAIFGAMSNSKYSTLQANCSALHCPASYRDDIDSGRTFQTVGNVGLVLGVVGLGAGATLFFLSGPKHSERTAQARPVRVLVGPGSIGLNGVF